MGVRARSLVSVFVHKETVPGRNLSRLRGKLKEEGLV
jgi:hypothetical protein